MITATGCNDFETDVSICDAYHDEFETSANEWFCIISKLGYSSFKDSFSNHNLSLATVFFCKSFSNRSFLKSSFKHLRANAELKFIQLEKIKKKAELIVLVSPLNCETCHFAVLPNLHIVLRCFGFCNCYNVLSASHLF